ATHPRVGDAMRDRLRRALLDMAADPDGRDMLARIPIGGLAPAAQADYPPRDGWGVPWIEGKE
ncbi:MAG TPA: PhnD/SsuA/transferrin family substrate-binding protein, partial [Candidatus Omnitrophota bacterium]|nr:PhnD/SsuA/transferrin family substrate-binding protein [Candidatus Omnitrophota bacterium]